VKDIKKEVEFHNDRIEAEEGLNRLSYMYKSVEDILKIPLQVNQSSIASVLEIGCFDGQNSLLFNCDYTGVDISDKAVEHAKRIYSSANRQFIIWDAHKLEELEHEYDYIFGNGIIHHCDIPIVARSLSAALAKEGRAVFLEPMQGPPWLRLFRKLTPQLRTEDEMPLTAETIDIFDKYFDVGERYFAIFRPTLPMLFGNHKVVINFSAKLDVLFNKIFPKLFKKWAWLVVLELKSKK